MDKDEYQCARCNGVFKKPIDDWSDEHAMKEFEERFDPDNGTEYLEVCDDCYKIIMNQ